MVLTPSTMLALGTPAPDFDLPDTVSGRRIRLGDYAAKKGLLVMFICRHCPYVQHVKAELSRLGQDYPAKGMAIVAISANDAAGYPDDAPDKLKEFAKELKLNYPLCYDDDQETAKRFTAACTPDFFLFDAQRRLVYRGQLDDSRPGNGKPVTGRDLRMAMDAVLAAKTPDAPQKPSIGCNIKWKPGNQPSYFRLS